MTNLSMPDEGATRWMYTYAKKNYWRCGSWVEFDDLIQLGYEAYYEVLNRYPTATEPAHVMSLFKLVYRSWIEDVYARPARKQMDDARSDIVDVFDGDAIKTPDTFTIHMLVTKAPQRIKKVLDVLVGDEFKELFNKAYEKKASGRRETLNDRICLILELDSNKNDVVRELKEYFAT